MDFNFDVKYGKGPEVNSNLNCPISSISSFQRFKNLKPFQLVRMYMIISILATFLWTNTIIYSNKTFKLMEVTEFYQIHLCSVSNMLMFSGKCSFWVELQVSCGQMSSGIFIIFSGVPWGVEGLYALLPP